jgi:hypothetical protein
VIRKEPDCSGVIGGDVRVLNKQPAIFAEAEFFGRRVIGRILNRNAQRRGRFLSVLVFVTSEER